MFKTFVRRGADEFWSLGFIWDLGFEFCDLKISFWNRKNYLSIRFL